MYNLSCENGLHLHVNEESFKGNLEMVCYYHEGYCVLTHRDPILYLVRVTIYFALKSSDSVNILLILKNIKLMLTLHWQSMLYTFRSLIVFCGNCTK